MRVLLSLLVLALLLLAVWGMYRGWQHRAQRQATGLGAFPAAPTDPGPIRLVPVTGLYVGSTLGGNWQNRIAVGDIGHRATTELSLHADGVLLNRQGASSIWLPRNTIEAARTDSRLAGKVMTKDGLLVLRWRVGEETVDTGFRADDKRCYREWVAALATTAPAPTETTKDGDIA